MNDFCARALNNEGKMMMNQYVGQGQIAGGTYADTPRQFGEILAGGNSASVLSSTPKSSEIEQALDELAARSEQAYDAAMRLISRLSPVSGPALADSEKLGSSPLPSCIVEERIRQASVRLSVLTCELNKAREQLRI